MATAYDLAWSTAASLTQVNALSARGVTSSTDATYTNLSSSTDKTQHAKKNGQVPTKYTILMTDGSNNATAEDTKTKDICAKAKKDGIEAYGVAFMAPTRGQQLLKACVTLSSNYFAAERMSELVSAFKAIGERASAVVARLSH